MSQLPEKKICKQCGEVISCGFVVTLPSLMRLTKLCKAAGPIMTIEETPNKAHVELLCELENLSREQAADYIKHEMGNCKKTYPPCPSCGNPLKSWHAKICLNCDWKKTNA